MGRENRIDAADRSTADVRVFSPRGRIPAGDRSGRNGRILHPTVNRDLGPEPDWYTMVEVFDPEGEAIADAVLHERIVLRAMDEEGRVHGIVSDPFPQARRYEVRIGRDVRQEHDVGGSRSSEVWPAAEAGPY